MSACEKEDRKVKLIYDQSSDRSTNGGGQGLGHCCGSHENIILGQRVDMSGLLARQLEDEIRLIRWFFFSSAARLGGADGKCRRWYLLKTREQLVG